MTLKQFTKLWEQHMPPDARFTGSSAIIIALHKAADGDFTEFDEIDRKLKAMDVGIPFAREKDMRSLLLNKRTAEEYQENTRKGLAKFRANHSK